VRAGPIVEQAHYYEKKNVFERRESYMIMKPPWLEGWAHGRIRELLICVRLVGNQHLQSV